mgnify:CR=1 FL=1
METYKWIWQYLKHHKLLMSIGLLLTLVSSALAMINPHKSQEIVDQVIVGKQTERLMGIIAIMIAATLIRSIIRYVFQMCFEHVSQNVVFSIRENIYSRLQEMDFDFFDKTRTGDIMARMTGDTDMIRHFVAWVIYMIFERFMIFVFAITMLFTIDVKFTLCLLAITPVVGYFGFKLATTVRPTFVAIREQFSRLNSVVQENISGNRVVKAFAKEDYEIEKFLKESEGFKEKNIISARQWEKYLPVLDSVAGSLNIVMILVGGMMVMRGGLTYGELVAYSGYIWALNDPMRMVGWLINDTQRFFAASEKVMKILSAEPKIRNSENVVEKNKIKGVIEFQNVGFSYGEDKVLKNISFKAKPGQTVAVIGPTGSGKSTLVSLICRFYESSEGEVLIDGINVKDMDIRKLRDNIAVAMQDIFLFSDTIEGNIAYGVPDASMDKVEWAAEVAGAHSFITNFSEGYDTIVGERGVGLSGGQKQRIALARALLKDPSILILDDTTSSVDMETEHRIHSSLKPFYKDKTTFIIAHRISSVKNADLILVLENGRIVEQGTHEELLGKRGHYFSVFKNQFGDFDGIYAAEVV